MTNRLRWLWQNTSQLDQSRSQAEFRQGKQMLLDRAHSGYIRLGYRLTHVISAIAQTLVRNLYSGSRRAVQPELRAGNGVDCMFQRHMQPASCSLGYRV